MENTPVTPEGAAAALDAAATARARLADSLVLPSAFSTSIGAATAVQIASAATGIAWQDTSGVLLLTAGLAVFTLTAVVQLARFRRRNGVWLAGLASQAVLGTATAGWTVYAGAFVAALWAAFSGAWWLVGASAVTGGVGYGLAGRRWLRTYRGDPEAHGRPASPVGLTLVGAAALAGLVLVVINH